MERIAAGWHLVEAEAATIRQAARKYAWPPVLEAADLYQLAAMKVGRYSGDRPAPHRQKGLVYRLAQRACVDALRRETGRKKHSMRRGRLAEVSLETPIGRDGQVLGDVLVAQTASPSAEVARQSTVAWLRGHLPEILASMKNRHAVCLVEKFYSGRRQYEIAEILGVTESAVSYMIPVALDQLRRRLPHEIKG